MKKTLLIILLMLITLSINAQVQRNILGLTLGVTTKASALKILKQKKIPILIDQEDKNRYFSESGFIFGGVNYELLQIDFVNNKLAAISMYSKGTYEEMQEKYNTITNNIRSKYKLDNGTIISEDTNTFIFNIYDDNTVCSCSFDSNNILTFIYIDMKLTDKKNQNIIDEY